MTATDRNKARQANGGFTLLEVMVALAFLAIALVGLISQTARNVRIAHEMRMMDVATDLVRTKMYDIERDLLKEGFPELTDERDGDFADEGWPDVKWEAVIEKVELPALGAMEAFDGEGEGDGDSGGERGGGGLLGGGLGLPGQGGLGGGLGGDSDGDGGGSGAMGMLGPYYETLKEVLEVSIRKVTVKVRWYVGQEDFEMEVACYFTDPYGMYKVLPQGF